MYDIASQMPDDLAVYVSYRLKKKRLLQKMTQAELGSKLGISSQQIQKYENGSNSLSLRMLEKAARVLGTSIDYFFDGYNKSDKNYLEDENRIVFEADILEKEVALLSKYFRKITNIDVRKKILSLVKSLSTMEESKL